MKDASVSEKHGEIKYDGERWLIVDTNSSNGTMINGVACTPKGTDVEFSPKSIPDMSAHIYARISYGWCP